MENLIRDAVAEHIRAIRKARKLTQEELAFRSGLTPSYISLIERKKQSISLKSLEKIAEALGVSTNKLLTTKEKTKSDSKHLILDEMSVLFKYFDKDTIYFILEFIRKLSQGAVKVNPPQPPSKRKRKPRKTSMSGRTDAKKTMPLRHARMHEKQNRVNSHSPDSM